MGDEARLAGTIESGVAVLADDEAPPPGVRAMSAVRWALLVLVAVAAAGAWLRSVDHRAHATQSARAYRCPMHPAVVRPGEGQCPVCGMDLAPVEGSATSTSNAPGLPGLVAVEIPAERTQLMGLRTAKVKRLPIAPEVRTVGSVAADEAAVAVVSMRSSGWIEQVLVPQTGAWVKRDQVLATIQGPELISAQESFLASVSRARKQDPFAVLRGVDDERKALLRLGMARLDIDALARSGRPFDAVPVRAPVSGYVAKKTAVAGLYPQPGSELFQIVDASTVSVVAEVDEQDVGRVAIGQRARISLAAWPGETFTGTLQFVAPELDPERRTLQARIRVDNARLKLRPGMWGDVAIEVAAVDALTVPADALIDTGRLQYVFVTKGEGRFEPRAVRPGASSGGRVQILDGLREGEDVVTAANFLVDAESRLRGAVEAR